MKPKQMKLLGAVLVLVVVLAASLFGGRATTQPQATLPTAAPPKSTQQGAAALPEGEVYSFRNQELLEKHFKKHGAEFGHITQDEYLQLANQLIASPNALRKTEKEDGDTVMFDEENGWFLVLSKDGYIRTFFCPDDGLAYYERQ